MYRIALHLYYNNNDKHYSNNNKNKQIGSNEKSLGDIQNVKTEYWIRQIIRYSLKKIKTKTNTNTKKRKYYGFMILIMLKGED